VQLQLLERQSQEHANRFGEVSVTLMVGVDDEPDLGDVRSRLHREHGIEVLGDERAQQQPLRLEGFRGFQHAQGAATIHGACRRGIRCR
jgi:hypothetical protein